MKRTDKKALKHLAGTVGVSFLLIFSSCNKDHGPIIVSPASPAPVSYGSEIQPIFTTNCVSGCHEGSTPDGNLNMEAANSHAQLVNVVADNYPILRVKPSSTDSSVLWHKVVNDNPGAYGGIMPPSPETLQTFEVDLIKKWINEGAKNN